MIIFALQSHFINQFDQPLNEKAKHKVILNANGADITILHYGSDNDYISLTDIAKYKNEDDAFIVINNWMRNKDTILFLGLWEKLYNPNFKPLEFDRFKNEAVSKNLLLHRSQQYF